MARKTPIPQAKNFKPSARGTQRAGRPSLSPYIQTEYTGPSAAKAYANMMSNLGSSLGSIANTVEQIDQKKKHAFDLRYDRMFTETTRLAEVEYRQSVEQGNPLAESYEEYVATKVDTLGAGLTNEDGFRQDSWDEVMEKRISPTLIGAQRLDVGFKEDNRQYEMTLAKDAVKKDLVELSKSPESFSQESADVVIDKLTKMKAMGAHKVENAELDSDITDLIYSYIVDSIASKKSQIIEELAQNNVDYTHEEAQSIAETYKKQLSEEMSSFLQNEVIGGMLSMSSEQNQKLTTMMAVLSKGGDPKENKSFGSLAVGFADANIGAEVEKVAVQVDNLQGVTLMGNQGQMVEETLESIEEALSSVDHDTVHGRNLKKLKRQAIAYKRWSEDVTSAQEDGFFDINALSRRITNDSLNASFLNEEDQAALALRQEQLKKLQVAISENSYSTIRSLYTKTSLENPDAAIIPSHKEIIQYTYDMIGKNPALISYDTAVWLPEESQKEGVAAADMWISTNPEAGRIPILNKITEQVNGVTKHIPANREQQAQIKHAITHQFFKDAAKSNPEAVMLFNMAEGYRGALVKAGDSDAAVKYQRLVNNGRDNETFKNIANQYPKGHKAVLSQIDRTPELSMFFEKMSETQNGFPLTDDPISLYKGIIARQVLGMMMTDGETDALSEGDTGEISDYVEEAIEEIVGSQYNVKQDVFGNEGVFGLGQDTLLLSGVGQDRSFFGKVISALTPDSLEARSGVATSVDYFTPIHEGKFTPESPESLASVLSAFQPQVIIDGRQSFDPDSMVADNYSIKSYSDVKDLGTGMISRVEKKITGKELFDQMSKGRLRSVTSSDGSYISIYFNGTSGGFTELLYKGVPLSITSEQYQNIEKQAEVNFNDWERKNSGLRTSIGSLTSKHQEFLRR